MLVLPGPGLLVILAGLTLFAAEFHWARRVLTALKGRYDGIRARIPLTERSIPILPTTQHLQDGLAVSGETHDEFTRHPDGRTIDPLPSSSGQLGVRAPGDDPATV